VFNIAITLLNPFTHRPTVQCTHDATHSAIKTKKFTDFSRSEIKLKHTSICKKLQNKTETNQTIL